jgi:hypothetical protein
MKKVLKKFLSLSLVLIVISSCSRDDHFKNYTYSNEYNFGTSTTGIYNASTSTLLDTQKISKTTIYTKNIEINTTEGIENIVVTNGISTSYPTITDKKFVINHQTKGIEGVEDITVTINYKNGNTKKLYIKLYTFINMLPIANLVYDANNKLLDFSSSFDQDSRYGGKINEYQVTINGVLRKKDENPNFLMTEINSIVAGKSYNIKLDIFDNDNSISTIEKTLNL